MDIRRTCSIVLEKRPDGLARLRYRIRWDGSRCIVSVNIPFAVDPDRWEPSTQRCRKNTWHGPGLKTPAARVNSEIAQYEDAVDDTFRYFELAEEMPTVDLFRAKLRETLGRESQRQEPTVAKVFVQFMADGEKHLAWTKRTIDKFFVLQHRLAEFDPNLTFSSLKEDRLNDLVYKWESKCEYRPATVDKMLTNLKQFLYWAEKKGYPVPEDFRDFKPKRKNLDKKIIFLEWSELMQVWGAQLSPAMSAIRDVFCFCCFTGLRYSDVANLKKYDIVGDCIVLTTVKTTDPLTIELNKYSREILSRYKDVELPGKMALPVISNQAMNRELKTLMEQCGIDKPVHLTYYKGTRRVDEVHPKYELITTHAGRRTFVCNALIKGIPANVVMQWTGHSDYAAMKPYIAIADSARAEAMKKFDE